MIVVPYPARATGESRESFAHRGLANIQDPEAILPDTCSRCRRKGTGRNPLMMEPVDRSPRSLARAYLYRAFCHDCRIEMRRRR